MSAQVLEIACLVLPKADAKGSPSPLRVGYRLDDGDVRVRQFPVGVADGAGRIQTSAAGAVVTASASILALAKAHNLVDSETIVRVNVSVDGKGFAPSLTTAPLALLVTGAASAQVAGRTAYPLAAARPVVDAMKQGLAALYFNAKSPERYPLCHYLATDGAALTDSTQVPAATIAAHVMPEIASPGAAPDAIAVPTVDVDAPF
ncbi:MAG: hypothetical protein RQ731_08060 [Anaerosomatales bacterium]|nr:hypothetical protein [Anaerosomatales bacterium]